MFFIASEVHIPKSALRVNLTLNALFRQSRHDFCFIVLATYASDGAFALLEHYCLSFRGCQPRARYVVYSTEQYQSSHPPKARIFCVREKKVDLNVSIFYAFNF